jgi:hypothetical protein
MSNRAKAKQKKKKAAPSSNPVSAAGVASTSANSGDSWREEARDGALLTLNFVKDLSESADVLSPLKGATAIVIRGLETARV